MGQFKPMVKMMTTEPSVILKLKKGGKVSKMAMGGNDYVPMQSTMPSQMPVASAPPMGIAPKRPPMMARRKAMNPMMMAKKGGSMDKHEDAAQDRAMIKKAMAGKKFASGGKIDSAETKTTIKGNASKFLNTKVVDGDKTDKAHGTKGIKEKNGGGYANGGTIKGNASKFMNTKVVDGDKTDKASGTSGVKMGNGGGYKKGGKVPGLGRAIEGGNWENRAADTSHGGVSNTTTGGVKNGNGGGFKKGGSTKKAYATGGTVNTGKPVAMPRKPMSRPVANSLQSGTFKKGGEVKKKEEKPNLRLVKTHTGPKGHVAKVYKDRDWEEYRTKFYTPEGKHLTEGDSHTDDLEDAHMTAKHEVDRGYMKGGKVKRYNGEGGSRVTPSGDPKVVTDKASRELEEALNPLSMMKEGYGKIRDYFTSKPVPAGSVTKTEKSVTVAPRKRGGRA
jgi:hypothetical protein